VLTAGPDSDCADEQALELNILPEFPFDSTYAVQAFTQCDESGFVLLQHSGLGVDELTWDFPNVLSSNELIVQANFPGTGLYAGTLTLYNATCDLTASFNIEADVPQPLSGVTYQIPNVISPNNDGRNDSFSAALVNSNDEAVSGLNPGDFYTYNLSIYNRWGNVVFESAQAGKAWRPALEVTEGTYYVVLSARHICDEAVFNYTGELSVVR
jgi:hypothetical protein